MQALLLSVAALTPMIAIAPSAQECSAKKSATLVSYEAGHKDIVDTAVAAGDFRTLATALTEAKLVPALKGKGPFTVFAPTDRAFANLPKGTLERLLKPENRGLLSSILTFHVVPGRFEAVDVVKSRFLTTLNGQRFNVQVDDNGVTIGGARVTSTDIECTNGVIHVIDAVIMPATKDIVGTAVEAGSFKTLAAALKAAHLVEALQGDGPFTVFAPTDEAFAKLPKGTVETLLKPENRERLAAVLKYHVVPGRVYADQAVTAGTAQTLQGSNITAGISDGRLTINGATVVSNDIETTNGVIHVIDTVLLP